MRGIEKIMILGVFKLVRRSFDNDEVSVNGKLGMGSMKEEGRKTEG